METPPPPRRKAGRPLSFDRDQALHRAMLTFWRHGFEATSISDLTAAMGVTAPSLYAAFGDKKQLFLAAMRLYAGPPQDVQSLLDRAPSARDAARDMLLIAAHTFTGDATPKGCLLASATASVSPQAQDVQDAVAAVRNDIRARLAARIAQDAGQGLLPVRTDAQTLAALVVGAIQGMSVLARDGVGRDGLLAVADSVLQGWPRPAGPAHPAG